jgi:hypothetical protein
MRTKMLQSVFLLAVVGALAGPVAAGDYQLILGKGTEVCEACLKNLQQQPVEDAVCDRQYAAGLELSAPEWKSLDLREHTEFISGLPSLSMMATNLPGTRTSMIQKASRDFWRRQLKSIEPLWQRLMSISITMAN